MFIKLKAIPWFCNLTLPQYQLKPPKNYLEFGLFCQFLNRNDLKELKNIHFLK
jgi:hypothetical protein